MTHALQCFVSGLIRARKVHIEFYCADFRDHLIDIRWAWSSLLCLMFYQSFTNTASFAFKTWDNGMKHFRPSCEFRTGDTAILFVIFTLKPSAEINLCLINRLAYASAHVGPPRKGCNHKVYFAICWICNF